VFPEHRTAGEAATAATADALKLYAEVFGPLGDKSLAVVEAEFPDGMEYDGLYFLGQSYFEVYFGGPQNFLTTLSAHETAHQWWYGLVANDQALEPWLDEALSTYSERLFYENYYPELVDWWWEFRVDLYAPEGSVDSAIYDYDGFRPYVNAVYLRGAQFLEAARELVGEDAFFATMQDLIARNSYNQVTTADFFRLLEANTEADLASLRQMYFDKP
jgi:aminopeptidase N